MTGRERPDDSAAWIEEFLGEVDAATKSWAYRIELREFLHFVSEHGGSCALTQRQLRHWLLSRRSKVCLSRVILAARITRRFLDWLIGRKIVWQNPLALLIERHECRSLAAIVRALLGPTPGISLEALRPLPRYGSHLGPAMREHILRMRSLGFRYEHEAVFLQFDRFLQRRPGAAGEPLAVLIREYAAVAASAHAKLLRFKTGRVLAKALARKGVPSVPVSPDRKLVREEARNRRCPFIFTTEQIALLLRTALDYPTPTVRAPLRSVTLYTMLVLTYCAGLRLGEIVNLKVRDLDLQQGVIEVRDTKFFKSRRLPLSSSAAETLREYSKVRAKAGASQQPEASLFIHAKGGYSYVAASHLLRDVIRRAGLHSGKGRNGARLHDLRHTFVVHRMTQWYREGVNPQGRLVHLATYLGHRDINSTLVYLTITQELLQQANSRFRAAEDGVLSVMKGDC